MRVGICKSPLALSIEPVGPSSRTALVLTESSGGCYLHASLTSQVLQNPSKWESGKWTCCNPHVLCRIELRSEMVRFLLCSSCVMKHNCVMIGNTVKLWVWRSIGFWHHGVSRNWICVLNAFWITWESYCGSHHQFHMVRITRES